MAGWELRGNVNGKPGKDAVVDEPTMRTLAEIVAERVYSLPPAADHFGLPGYVQYNSRFQEMIAVMVHQALMQYIFMAGDEGLANLVKSGWQSKVE